MKIYIAAHDQGLAKAAQAVLQSAGHEIVSSWLQRPFERTASYTQKQRTEIADLNEADVSECDVLVLLSGQNKYAGGKFVEAGIARALGKRVVVVGYRENMQLWASYINQVSTVEEVVTLLSENGDNIENMEVANAVGS